MSVDDLGRRRGHEKNKSDDEAMHHDRADRGLPSALVSAVFRFNEVVLEIHYGLLSFWCFTTVICNRAASYFPFVFQILTSCFEEAAGWRTIAPEWPPPMTRRS